MSAIANANARAMRARTRRAVAGAPFDGGALAMLQDIVDNFVVPELDGIDLPLESSLVSAVLASVEPAARYAEASLDIIVANCICL